MPTLNRTGWLWFWINSYQEWCLGKNDDLFSVSCYGGMYRAISIISAEDQKAWIMCVRESERRGGGTENDGNLCPGLKTTSFPQIISMCTSITTLSLYNCSILCYKPDLGPNKNGVTRLSVTRSQSTCMTKKMITFASQRITHRWGCFSPLLPPV